MVEDGGVISDLVAIPRGVQRIADRTIINVGHWDLQRRLLALL